MAEFPNLDSYLDPPVEPPAREWDDEDDDRPLAEDDEDTDDNEPPAEEN